MDRNLIGNLPRTVYEGGVSLASGDFDGVGDQDFIASNTSDPGIYLYTNNGKAKFDSQSRIANLPGTTYKGSVAARKEQHLSREARLNSNTKTESYHTTAHTGLNFVH
jgi:hypothetical protein